MITLGMTDEVVSLGVTDGSLMITLRNILDNCFDTSTSVLYIELLKIIT